MYRTLGWILTRKQPLSLLSLDDVDPDPRQVSSPNPNISDMLTPTEVHLLQCLSNRDSNSGSIFWATAGLAKVLADWGHWFSYTVHHCPCHLGQEKEEKPRKRGRTALKRKPSGLEVAEREQPLKAAWDTSKSPCPMIGRTAVLLASGLPELAIERLRSLSVPPSVQQTLDTLDEATSSDLLRQFRLAISRLAFRTKQNFSYWSQLPWSLLMVMRPFVEYFHSQADVPLAATFEFPS